MQMDYQNQFKVTIYSVFTLKVGVSASTTDGSGLKLPQPELEPS